MWDDAEDTSSEEDVLTTLKRVGVTGGRGGGGGVDVEEGGKGVGGGGGGDALAGCRGYVK